MQEMRKKKIKETHQNRPEHKGMCRHAYLALLVLAIRKEHFFFFKSKEKQHMVTVPPYKDRGRLRNNPVTREEGYKQVKVVMLTLYLTFDTVLCPIYHPSDQHSGDQEN